MHKRVKVIHLDISFKGSAGALEVVGKNREKVCHVFDYGRSGRYVTIMHQPDETCAWCGKVENYTKYI